MGREDDYLPSDELIGFVLVTSICPLLGRTERHFKIHLPAEVQVCVRDDREPPLPLSCPTPTQRARGASSWPTVHGQAHLRFRSAFHTWRKLFFFQAIYPEPPNSDFSGFQVKGELRFGEAGFKENPVWSARVDLLTLSDSTHVQVITDSYVVNRIGRRWIEWV